MNFHHYLPRVVEWASPLADNDQVMHAQLGMLSEIGELADMVKKHHAYGRDVDKINGCEEIGDFCWYVALYCHERGISGQQLDLMTENSVAEPLKSAVRTLGGLAGALCIEEDDRGSLDRDVLKLMVPLLQCISMHFEATLYQTLDKNVDKLEARNRGKQFNLEGTLNRDLENERSILSRDHLPDTNS